MRFVIGAPLALPSKNFRREILCGAFRAPFSSAILVRWATADLFVLGMCKCLRFRNQYVAQWKVRCVWEVVPVTCSACVSR